MPLPRRLLLASLLCCVAGSLPATAATLVIDCDHLFDSAGGKLLGPRHVVIDGDRIVAVAEDEKGVENAIAATPDARIGLRKDAHGMTCVPGLIDAHVHLTHAPSPKRVLEQFQMNPADYALRGAAAARITLLAGFTTVRNLHDDHNESIALRGAVEKGWIIGPRILSVGHAIGSTGGHVDPTDGWSQEIAGDPGPMEGVINSVDDARKAVRQRYKDGADGIKIVPSGGVLDLSRSGDNAQMTLDEIKALVETAHDYGFLVAAHAHGKEALRRSILGGVDSIEHGTYLDAELFELMKKHGTWLCPTISAGKFVAEHAKIPGYFPDPIVPKALAIGPQIQGTAGAAYKAGVKMLFGTDAGVYPHGENAREFQFMVEAGIPAAVALQSATSRSAEALRLPDRGVIAPGKLADVALVEGDPLADITAMQRVRGVVKGGVLYDAAGTASVPAPKSP